MEVIKDIIKNFWKNFKSRIIIFGIGFLSGAFIVFYTMNPDKNIDPSKYVTTKQISGDPITHSDFDVDKNTITFNTTSTGVGEIQTVIQKTMIPEARYWIEKTSAVSLIGGYDVRMNPSLNVMYWHRWGSFSAGAGIQIKSDPSLIYKIEPSLQLGIMYWY